MFKMLCRRVLENGSFSTTINKSVQCGVMTRSSTRTLRVEPLEERALLSVSGSDLSLLVGASAGIESDAGTADYGDAPDTFAGAGVGDYNTTASNNGPSHTVIANLYMGAAVDGDDGTLQNTAANTDDTNQALPDDEDGLSNPAVDLMLTHGAQPTINVIVTNTTGAASDGEVENFRATITAPTYGFAKSTVQITDDIHEGPDLSHPDLYGSRIASLGDLNGDGLTDLAAGTSNEEMNVMFMGSPSDLASGTFVDADSPAGSNGDGLSWSTAFNSLETALQDIDERNNDLDALNDTLGVWIADGIYVPENGVSELSGVRNYSFQLPSDIPIIGGFQGNESSKDERSRLEDGSLEYETILSGDRLQNDLDGDTTSKADNSQSVIFVHDAENIELEGVTVEGGYADGTYTNDSYTESESSGAGMYLNDSNALLREVTFRDNYSIKYGGGLRSRISYVEIFGCHFLNNRADDEGGGINFSNHTMWIENSRFEDNSSALAGGGGRGYTSTPTTIRNTSFLDNASEVEGGGFYVASAANLEHVIVIGNSAPTGAGLSIISSAATLTNCTVVGNEGFGISTRNSPTLKNTVVALNEGDVDGYASGYYNLIGNKEGLSGIENVYNGNIVGAATSPIDPLFVRNPSDGGDGWGDDPATSGVDEGANDDYGDLRLRFGSPAIDEGSSSYLPVEVTTDYYGAPRVIDSDADGRADIDIGVAEFIGIDVGDAPDSAQGTGLLEYQTLVSDGGPSHSYVSGLHMGATVDVGDGALQNTAANADDVEQTLPDDEDGLLNPTQDLTITIGSQPMVNVAVTNTTGAAAILSGWIDYNGNGVFENDWERAQATVPDGTTSEIVTLMFPYLRSNFTGTTYARFRLSTDPAAEDPVGPALGGEVEDYVVTIYAPTTGVVESTAKIASGTPGMSSLSDYDLFGNAVTQIGDLDNDGIVDLVVGATGDDTGGDRRGTLHVLFMNADGSVKSTQEIASDTSGGPSLSDLDFLGTSLRAIGDLNSDGVIDLTAGAYGDDTGGTGRGAVYVLMMNADGTAQSTTKIASDLNGGPTLSDYDYFGWSLDGIGDLDGDGVTDIAVAAHNANIGGNGRGAVHVLFMNPDGTVKSSQLIAHNTGGGPSLSDNDNFGRSLASLGDIDGDGVTDLAVGADRDDTSGADRGAVHILFMNSDGTAKSTQKIASAVGGGPFLADSDKFGTAVAPLGDMNGDGITDLAVGAREDDTGSGDSGAVYLLRMNSDGTVAGSQKIAHDLNGGPSLNLGDRFGSDVVSIGDLNGDGVSELAVGAWGDDTGGTDAGAVHILFMEQETLTIPSVLYVDVDSTYDPSAGDSGTSWATALPDLQHAIDLATFLNIERPPADYVPEIWVSEGTYVPTSLSDANRDGEIDDDVRSKTFTLRDGVAIYGGFAGDEADRDSRNGGETILSGDLNGDDSTGGDNSENAYTVVTAKDLEQKAVLDRVTITAGNANGIVNDSSYPPESGGGVHVYDSTPLDGELLLSNVIVTGNNAIAYGGGTYSRGVLSIHDSIIDNNTAYLGAGIADGDSSLLSIVNSLVQKNHASSDGGGIYNSGHINITNSTIAGNYAERDAGGIDILPYYSTAVITINNTIIAENRAPIEAHDLRIADQMTVIGNNNLIGIDEGQTYLINGVNGNIVGIADARIDPFLDSDTEDFRLGTGSLALDAGDSLLAVYPDATPIVWDILGDPHARVQGGAVDIGAYEGPVTEPIRTYVVNDLGSAIAQDGVITLPEAIAAANANASLGDALAGSAVMRDVIEFAPGLTGTITLNGAELFVNSDLQINGPGAELITIDANALSRIIRIEDPNLNNSDSPQVIISGLTLKGGNTGDVGDLHNDRSGGAIWSNANLTLDQVVINNNYANGSGGGIVSFHELMIEDSTISNNSASTSSGGGIYSYYGKLTLSNCMLLDNTAVYGGGIDSYRTPTVIEYSTFSGNDARRGGGIEANYDTIRILGSTFTQNSADEDGGAIFCRRSTLDITDSLLNNNDSNDLGGAIYCDYDAIITLANSVISENSARYSGGGIYNSSSAVTTLNSTIASNSATRGGGVYLHDDSSSELKNTILAGNEASIEGSDAYQTSSAVLTGSHSLVGIYSETSGLVNGVDGNIIGDQSTPIDPFLDADTNDLRLAPGSPALDAGDSLLAVYPDGSPISWDLRGTPYARILGSSVDIGAYEGAFSGSPQTYVVTDLGRAIAADGVITLPEAIAAANANAPIGDAPAGSPLQDIIEFAPGLSGTIRLRGVELVINSDIKIDGPGTERITIDAENMNRILRVEDPDTSNTDQPRVMLTGLTLSNGYQAIGGGIWSNANLTLQDVVVTDCWVFDNGGGIYNLGKLTINDSSISNNESRDDGGGIFNSGSELTIGNSLLSNNSAEIGGGIRSESGITHIVDSSFSGNSASRYGGALYNYTSTAYIANTEILGNTATYHGGGIYLRSGNLRITGSLIANNSAGSGGGALRNYLGTMEVYNSTIAYNSASYGGGSHQSDSASVSSMFINSIIAGNTANTTGTDVSSVDEGILTAAHCLIGESDGTLGIIDGVNGNMVGTTVSPIGPMFVNPAKGDYRLRPGSPVVGAGDAAQLPPDEYDLDNDDDVTDPLPVDLAGMERVSGVQLDMGAYEFDVNSLAQVTCTAGDDIIHMIPGTPGGADHRVSVNGGTYVRYDASVISTIQLDGLTGEDTLSIHGKATTENVTFDETSVLVNEASVYDIFGDNFNNVYVYSNGGDDTATIAGTLGNDDLYVNEGYSYLRGDSRSFLNYVKGFDSVTFDAGVGGTDRAYIYDGAGNDIMTAGETQMVLDYNSVTSPGVDVRGFGFQEINAYAVNGGNDEATLIGSAGNDRFTVRDLYGRMRGNDGAYIHYAEGFDMVTGDASNTTGTDIAILFDGSGNDHLEAGETSAALDLDATPGVDDFDLIANGFDQTYAYAIRGGDDTALMMGSGLFDLFTSKRTYSTLKHRDGFYFNYATGFDKVTADVSGGTGGDLAFLYDDTTDDVFVAGPTLATLDYDATGSSGVDTTVIGFDEVYAYADNGGNDTAILTGGEGLDRFTSLPTYSYLKADDDTYFNYARGFDAVTANSVGAGDLAFMYDSDGNDVMDSGSESVVFTLNLTTGGQVVNTATAFDQVYGYASGGGEDTAHLTGTTSADAFKGDANWGYLRSKGTSDYFNYVRYFDQVFADPGDDDVGNDELDDLGVSYALDSDPGNGNVW
jgi:predicted outer membrane repeat protein